MSNRDSICELVAVEYRDAPGFEGVYRVGSDGTVWTRRRRGRRTGKLREEWKRLRGRFGKGYLFVALFGDDGSFVRKSIHRLVLEAFVGPCPDGMECCHNDGNKQNNTLENLRWDTKKANHADQVRHGTRRYTPGIALGSANGSAKLNEHQVVELRKLAADGASEYELAIRYGVGHLAIRYAIERRTWRHI